MKDGVLNVTFLTFVPENAEMERRKPNQLIGE